MTPLQSFILKAVCINVPIGILLLGPKDAVLKYIWAHRFDAKSTARLWHYETLAVCALVAAVVILSGNDPVEWVGFAALTLAHGRNSVMFRLTEAQQRSTPVDPHHVECWRWNTIYFLLAECFWAGYFVLHRSWAALAGVVIFVGYGQWRRWYGRRESAAQPMEDKRYTALEGKIKSVETALEEALDEKKYLREVIEAHERVFAFALREAQLKGICLPATHRRMMRMPDGSIVCLMCRAKCDVDATGEVNKVTGQEIAFCESRKLTDEETRELFQDRLPSAGVDGEPEITLELKKRVRVTEDHDVKRCFCKTCINKRDAAKEGVYCVINGPGSSCAYGDILEGGMYRQCARCGSLGPAWVWAKP